MCLCKQGLQASSLVWVRFAFGFYDQVRQSGKIQILSGLYYFESTSMFQRLEKFGVVDYFEVLSFNLVLKMDLGMLRHKKPNVFLAVGTIKHEKLFDLLSQHRVIANTFKRPCDNLNQNSLLDMLKRSVY